MRKLTSGLGIWQIMTSNIITDIISNAGFDLALIDFEHGLNNPNTLQDIVFTAKSNQLITIARLPSISYENISQIIDTGVDGILYPHIEDITQLESVIKKTFLPPIGSRGYSPFTPKYYYSHTKNKESKEPLIGILIESKKGLKNLETLLQNSFVDFVYFGAYDLSVEINKIGNIYDPEIFKELVILSQLCKVYKKKSMAIYRNKEELEKLIKLNINYPIASVDTNIFLKSLTTQKEMYRNYFKD